LEVNPRATPTCHISAKGQDLAGSLFAQITGKQPKASYCVIHQDTFTLFPAGLPGAPQTMPNASSEDDAPDDEPEYVNACRAQEKKQRKPWHFVERTQARN